MVGPGGKSPLQGLKKPARRASWSKFKAQAAHLAWVDSFCDTGLVLEGIAASKIEDFAGEADAADADVLSRYAPDGIRRCAVLACLVHTARSRARDDLAQMLCKRMAISVKKAKDQMEEFHKRQRSVMEQLIGAYQQVLRGLAPAGPVGVAQDAAAQMVLLALAALAGAAPDAESGDGQEAADHEAAAQALLKAVRVQAAGVGSVLQTVEDAGGFDSQLADIEGVMACFH